jgi:hypothetical protein
MTSSPNILYGVPRNCKIERWSNGLMAAPWMVVVSAVSVER